MKSTTILRFGVAIVLAATLVLGVTSYIVVKTQKPARGVMMRVVKGINQISMEEVKALTKDHSPQAIKKPEKPPVPPRQVSGIVQVAYTVQPDGSATNVRIIGAAPQGYFEDKAKSLIKNSYHQPAMSDDGHLRAKNESKIFHFTEPAHDAKAPVNTPRSTPAPSD